MAMTHGAGAPRRERDWRRVLAASGLPSEAKGLIERVVRRARLWPRERADVCRELVSHFQGGLERGATTAELIGDFGDPALASKMIGRGKRRARPLIWHALVRTGQAVGALVLALAGAYLYFAAALWLHAPKITRNYALELDAEALAVPADERAWPVMERAVVSVIDMPLALDDRRRVITMDDCLNGMRESRQYLAGGLAECRREVEALYRVRDYDAIGFVATQDIAKYMDRWWGRSEIPQNASTPVVALFGTHRFVADCSVRLLLRDVEVGLVDRDPVRVEQGLLSAIHLGRLCGRERTTATESHGVRVVQVTADLVRYGLCTEPGLFSDAFLYRLMNELGDDADLLVASGDADRLRLDDTLQRAFVDDGSGDGWFDLRAVRAQPEIMFEEQLARLDWMTPALAAAVVAPRSAQIQKFDTIKTWEQRRALNEHVVDRIRYWPVVRSVRSSAHERYTEEVALRRDATLVAIALELKRRDTGEWATSIDELFPEYLQRMPVDIYDRQTLRLRVIDGQPVVYSVGMDLDDDGGRPAQEGERILNTPYAGPMRHPPGVKLRDGDLILFPIDGRWLWNW